MREPSGREAARGDWLLSAACAALALLALAMPRPWAASFSAKIRDTALRPLVSLRSRAENDRTSRFRLDGIERSRDSLALIVHDQAALGAENANLRAMLELRARVTQPYRTANVLHRPAITDRQMLLLDIGSADGVSLFDPVITGDGLLGFIWSVDSHSSTVETWVHPDFRAAAVTADGKVPGMISPLSSGEATRTVLEMRGVPLRDSLAIGTVVFTSGIGGVYPLGLKIGTIAAVGREEQGYERIYRVLPFANPASATQVIVLITPHGTTFAPLPGPDSPPHARDSVPIRKDSIK